MQNRNYNLDLIKIIACIAVVGLHTLQKDLSIVNTTLYYICTFAVPIFFMSSGYILLNRSNIPFMYILKKISAIMRVVILWAAICFLGKNIGGFIKGNINGIDILYFLELIIKSLVQKGILWHFWYLGALIIVYMCLPILLKLKKSYWQYILPITVSCVIQISSYLLGEPIQSHCIQTFRIWTWLQYFILGGLIGYKNPFDKSSFSVKRHIVCLALITVFIVVYYNLAGRFLLHNLYAEYFYDSIFTVLWTTILFTLIIRIKLTPKHNMVIGRLGSITMGVYILHPLIIKIIGSIITINSILISLVYFIGILFLSAICAGIISKIPLIEKLIKL